MLRVLRICFAAAALLVAGWAGALEVQPYSPKAFAAAQSEGRPVALQFRADWCPTCRKQDKALKALQADPALKDVVVFVADYDTEEDLKQRMNVRVQSTLIVFRGTQERARSAGITEAERLKADLARAQ